MLGKLFHRRNVESTELLFAFLLYEGQDLLRLQAAWKGTPPEHDRQDDPETCGG
jgi:hypothetical protein